MRKFGPCAAIVVLVATTACLEPRAFACEEDDECTLEPGGRCEPEGWCSYDDPECASGRRFEGLAPDVGGTCVAFDLSCESYCTLMPTVCDGRNPYDSPETCLAECGQWPVGTADDVTGDSLGCRLNALDQAADNWNPDVNCRRAWPSSDGTCRDPDAPDCATYCMAFIGNCQEPLVTNGLGALAFQNAEDCEPICGSWYPGTVEQEPQNSVGCRVFHTMAATMVPDTDPDAGEMRLALCRAGSPEGGETCQAQ